MALTLTLSHLEKNHHLYVVKHLLKYSAKVCVINQTLLGHL